MADSYRGEVGGGGGGSRRLASAARSPADGSRRWDHEEGLGEEAYCVSVDGGGGQL
jgi:hypothetical protein